MEISYFREFVVLAETQNYWAASERLFIGQSSLSKHIKTLERQLGAPLFDRSSRRVALTEFGRLMLPYAQKVASLQYEYEAAAFNYRETGGETLRLASIPVIAHYNITDILVRFQLDFPTVEVQLQEADSIEVREWLLECKCDLCFYRDSPVYFEHDPDKEAQMVKIPYWQDRLVAVLPRDHPLAGQTRLELGQLADEVFALIKKDTMPYNLCIRACREAGFAPQVVFTSHSLEAILDMVTKGSCVALLFANHVAFPHPAGKGPDTPFVAVPVAPEISTTIYLAYRKGAPLSEAATHFVDYCQLKGRPGIDSK